MILLKIIGWAAVGLFVIVAIYLACVYIVERKYEHLYDDEYPNLTVEEADEKRAMDRAISELKL